MILIPIALSVIGICVACGLMTLGVGWLIGWLFAKMGG